jgi:hypothetical protein
MLSSLGVRCAKCTDSSVLFQISFESYNTVSSVSRAQRIGFFIFFFGCCNMQVWNNWLLLIAVFYLIEMKIVLIMGSGIKFLFHGYELL